MVVLNRIYTRTGDDGTTSLGTGARRKKYDLRVEAYGTVDEVNAVIGLVRLHTAGDAALDAALGRIQNDLFDVEADLCLAEKGPGGARLTVTDAQVAWLEAEIDRLNAELEPLKSFILPGGSPASAYLHLARTVCRRAERIMVELKDQPGRGGVGALAQIRQPAVGLSVRRRPLCQRQGRRRRAVGARAKSLARDPENAFTGIRKRSCAISMHCVRRSINVDMPMARPLASARSCLSAPGIGGS